MRITRQLVVFDAADMAAESSFWAGLLDGTVDADDDWHTVLVEGKPSLAVQLAPDHRPPDWPDGSPQQIHLDIYVDDPPAAHEKVLALGARALSVADSMTTASGFSVYADPAGHPFCICWG